jgi:hypothetical protein
MGRIRLVALFFVVACLFLCAYQEAAAQSPHVMVSPSLDNAGPVSEPTLRIRIRPPQPRPRAAEIFFCETPDTSCRTTQDVFPLAELRDLYVFVVWPGVAGQHVQTMEFFLPDGSTYFSKKTQFIIGGVMAFSGMSPVAQNHVAPTPPARHLIADANKIHPDGIPSLLMKSRGDSSILTVLPVGGTYITQRSLSGTWRVRVLLDDRLVLESAFTLTSRTAPAKAEEEAGSRR